MAHIIVERFTSKKRTVEESVDSTRVKEVD